MLNVIEQPVETSHKEPFIPQYKVPEITVFSNEKTVPVNYLKQLHRCGIRKNDHVLVVGATNIEMLCKLAGLIGSRGKITVLDDNPIALTEVRTAAEAGQFKAFKQFSGGHPAFDLRSSSKKYVPVEVVIEPLPSGALLFTNNQFDVVWVEQQPKGLTVSESNLWASELKRVTNGAIIQPGS